MFFSFAKREQFPHRPPEKNKNVSDRRPITRFEFRTVSRPYPIPRGTILFPRTAAFTFRGTRVRKRIHCAEHTWSRRGFRRFDTRRNPSDMRTTRTALRKCTGIHRVSPTKGRIVYTYSARFVWSPRYNKVIDETNITNTERNVFSARFDGTQFQDGLNAAADVLVNVTSPRNTSVRKRCVCVAKGERTSECRELL